MGLLLWLQVTQRPVRATERPATHTAADCILKGTFCAPVRAHRVVAGLADAIARLQADCEEEEEAWVEGSRRESKEA